MTRASIIARITRQEDVNFLLTNAMPRRLATRLVGWLSRIKQPLICSLLLRLWQVFAEIDFSDAAETRFRSLHDCFTRTLKPGARPIDPDPAILVSPCDGIVGAHGIVRDGAMLQVKGSTYGLRDLLDDDRHAASLNDARYVTLRLTSGMYHHFHAPHDCTVAAVSHIHGDVFNVNTATLRRIDRLFCRNERAVISARLADGGERLTLIAVAAILVAGIRLRAIALPPAGARVTCDVRVRKGCELGWFEHGSTIIVIAPASFEVCADVEAGTMIRVGRPLLRRRAPHA
ncbi:archaetidylserine decarboxylase [Lichenicoccus sp.]|uniref:archaetidylserine decarboxylase n=1 Tax=Lichenicoccus sp. TaxID=2781899 RepID=UPI003D0E5B9A